MTDTLITPTLIARESIRHLENNLVMGKLVHRQYESEFKGSPKTGGTVTIRKPVKFEVSDGATLSKQDITEQSTTISVNQRKHVAWDFLTQDLTLTVEKYSERYVQPAMIALANKIDTDVLTLYSDVVSAVGTAGTNPDDFDDILACRQQLQLQSSRMDGLNLVINPTAERYLAQTFKDWYAPNTNTSIINTGMLGMKAGFNIYCSQNVATHTAGTQGGTPLVDGASQTGSTINLKGFSASITDVLKAGDIITLAGVNRANYVAPFSDAGQLQQFTVTADCDSDGSGDVAVSIDPPITISGEYTTVTASPADGAAVTVVTGSSAATSIQNLAFHRDAFALVTVPLVMPDGVAFKAREEFNGISLRVLKDYDMTNDQEIIRIDVLYGIKTLYPYLATRLLG